jgi:hypothetical protein
VQIMRRVCERLVAGTVLARIVRSESALDQPRHRPMILFDEANARRLVPPLPVAGTKFEIEPCMIRQHTKPEALRSPVAVDEGMTRVSRPAHS